MDTKPADAANTRVPSRWRAALDAVSAFSMIVASIAILWAVIIRPTTANVPVAPAPSEPGTPVSLSGAVVDGDPNAPFAIVEFSDFRCPACTAFARDTLPTIRRLYVETGKALFAFRTLPLERQHPGSRELAAIARCAGEQGKFWTLHDYLFRAPEPVDASALQSIVPALGLNTAQLETCRTTAQTLQLVENDILAARTLGLEGTPTFLFGPIREHGTVTVVRRLTGAAPTQRFVGLVDELLRGHAK